MMKSLALIETQYLPCIAFFSAMVEFDLHLEMHENYQKRSLRNKCFLASSQGSIQLSVPLKAGKHQQAPIIDVLISYEENWQQLHVRTIESCYRSAPFFEYYFDEWKALLSETHTHLATLNARCIDLIIKQLSLNTTYKLSKDFKRSDVQNDLRDLFSPRNFTKFQVSQYAQVFGAKYSFISNLSILDLIFCCGPEGSMYLIWPDNYL